MLYVKHNTTLCSCALFYERARITGQEFSRIPSCRRRAERRGRQVHFIRAPPQFSQQYLPHNIYRQIQGIRDECRIQSIGEHAHGYFAESLHDAALALVADGEDVDAMFIGYDAVQCDIAGTSL